jgi:hypothetical protein
LVSQSSSARIGALLAFVLGACAHAPKLSTAEEIRSAAESFHERIRWRDFHGAGELLVPERREMFEQALKARGDERDLSISDYELEKVRISPDGKSAAVASRVSWTRLPSVSEKTEQVTSEFILRDGSWLISRQEGGPFALELGKKLPAAHAAGAR